MNELNLFDEEVKTEKPELEKMTKAQLLKVIEELRIKSGCAEYIQIKKPENVAMTAINKIKSMPDFDPYKEHFILICLNTKSEIIKSEIVSIGHLTGSLVHPREVFKSAILANAHSVIIAHNHPSGSIEPSYNDDDITKTIKRCGEFLQIPLLDHVIFTMTNEFYSYAKEGGL